MSLGSGAWVTDKHLSLVLRQVYQLDPNWIFYALIGLC
jgi:hypothetical protein